MGPEWFSHEEAVGKQPDRAYGQDTELQTAAPVPGFMKLNRLNSSIKEQFTKSDPSRELADAF